MSMPLKQNNAALAEILSDINALPTMPQSVAQATPTISVSSDGLITVTSVQNGGVVQAGTKTVTKQLSTQEATVITPADENQIVVSAGTYVTGDIIVEAVESSGADTSVVGGIIDGTAVTVFSDTATSIRSYCFYGLDSLESIDLPEATSMEQRAFYNCSGLAYVNLPKTTNVHDYAFRNCTSLEEINLPSVTKMYTYAFQGCTALRKVDLSKVTTMSYYNFQNCSALEALIIRTNSVCTVESGNFNGSGIANGTGYIYVPSSLVDSYKTATNWVTYADQIRAIEDYPDIAGS